MKASYQNVFSRYEKKYMLNADQFLEMTDFLKENMEEDHYYNYTLGSIYCDTPDFLLIRRSMEKPVYKEKFRIRTYGDLKENPDIFLEIKKKYKGVVYKRRAVMSEDSALEFIANGICNAQNSQIDREIEWFINFYNPEPKVYIAYDRSAFRGIEDPSLRVTFDNNIRWRGTDLRLSAGTWGDPLLDPDIYIMEIKMQYAMPLWLAKKLSDMKLLQTSFSKYAEVYSHHIFNKNVKTGDINYA